MSINLKMLIIVFLICSIADFGTWYLLPFSADSVLFEICLIVDYDLFQISIVLMHLYIIAVLEDRISFGKVITYAPLVVCAVLGVLWATSKWNGIFYTISDDGYIHSIYHIWSQIPGIIIALVDLGVIMLNWKKVNTNERIAYLSYVVVSVGADILGVLCNVAVLYLGFSIVILIMYVQIDVEKDKIISQKEAELVEAQSRLLVSQIKPHFINNCLAVIQVLCRKDPELAAQVVKRFSNFLRSIMDSIDNRELVTFEQEMYIVNNYLYIEKVRFQDKINVEKTIEVEDFLLPSLTIQPIVENAVKYGLRARAKGGTVKIHSYETDKEYCVEISDDGPGFDISKVLEDGKKHIGMRNVNERLKCMCNGHIAVESKIETGTNVVIHIPK